MQIIINFKIKIKISIKKNFIKKDLIKVSQQKDFDLLNFS
jgi:hypothetical protein